MSLSSSMWASVSGLLQHGEKMNVIGNNLANVNTVGFKGQRMDFADFVYQDAFSLSGTTQIGKGVQIGAVMGDFGTGSFESSTETTDLAISGSGFFKVSPIGMDASYYTRAGNFRFSESGELLDPNGYCVQGWQVQNSDDGDILHVGAVTDVKLEKWTADPKRTTTTEWQMNLTGDAGKTEKCTYTETPTGSTEVSYPFCALAETWNGLTPDNDGNYISNDKFMHSASMEVYDEGGKSHTLTVYLDKVNSQDFDDTQASPHRDVWEYIVTMDPKEDKRRITDGSKVTDISETSAAGMLMAGTLTFDNDGKLTNQSAFVFGGTDTTQYGADSYNDPAIDPAVTGNVPVVKYDANGKVDIADNMYPAKISTSGYPLMVANFSGIPQSQTMATELSENEMIEVNFGLKANGTQWSAAMKPNASLKSLSKADTKAATPTLPKLEDMGYEKMASSGSAATGTPLAQPNVFTNYKGESTTQGMSQDGYTYGNLSNYTVDKSGVLFGVYSNGQNLPLFQIAMYDFHCKQGLRREGNNLFSQTRESGEPMEGVAGTGTFGTVNSNNLEGSNVDIATEFVRMITTQRGFQANSKNITTTDTMLETVINMKR